LIKAVILDWGGVMNAAAGAHSIRQGLATQLGMDLESARPILRAGIYELMRGTIDESAFWQKLERAHGATIPPAKRNIWVSWDNYRPDPGMLALIENLHVQGVKIALLSNSVPAGDNMIDSHHALDNFDIVVRSTAVGLIKPEPEIYQLVLKKLALKPSECLFVDDQQRMLDPAAATGMRTILATDPDTTIKEIENELKS
jgi:epoxide hydrolase-like predicted phosphatase